METNSNRLNIVINNDDKTLSIGDQAPLFNALSTFGDIKLSDYAGKWLVFFSHPGAFTPVCTTEFITFSRLEPEFTKRNCSLLGLSVDSNSANLAWVHNIQNLTGLKVPFPVISDINMKIANMYHMISPAIDNTKTVRCVFILDPNQTIRAILTYPMTTGRNIDEILRMVDALQKTDSENVATPANWIPGAPTLQFSPNNYEDLLKKSNYFNSQCPEWYLCFNQDNNQNS